MNYLGEETNIIYVPRSALGILAQLIEGAQKTYILAQLRERDLINGITLCSLAVDIFCSLQNLGRVHLYQEVDLIL